MKIATGSACLPPRRAQRRRATDLSVVMPEKPVGTAGSEAGAEDAAAGGETVFPGRVDKCWLRWLGALVA
jgi:hypothetical protein